MPTWRSPVRHLSVDFIVMLTLYAELYALYAPDPICSDAVSLLKQEGYTALHLRDGVAEWAIESART